MEIKVSPVKLTIELLAKKWMTEILEMLYDGKQRFSDILHANPEISSKVLSERLRELFDLNLVEKIVSNAIPLKMKYQITEKGRLFQPVLFELAKVGIRVFSDQVFGHDQYLNSYLEVEQYFQKYYDI